MKQPGLIAVFFPFFLAQIVVVAPAQKNRQRLHLLPQVSKGQVLRYDVSYHRISRVATESMVENPTSAVNADVSVRLSIRVEITGVALPANGETGVWPAIRLRATYTHAQATQRSDDPAEDDRAAEKAIEQIEGKAFECQVAGDGAAACAAAGTMDPTAAEGMRRWLLDVFAGARLPQKGIFPGQVWEEEQDAGGEIPLAGLRSGQKYTFLGEKPCREVPSGAARKNVQQPTDTEACAEIRVHSALVQKGSKKNATPQAFREKGLRTAGTATGESESLIRISLATGLVVSFGESGRRTADYIVSSATGGTKIRTTLDVKTNAGLRLAPEEP